MKVHIVMFQEYDAAEIEGVFLKKQAAETFRQEKIDKIKNRMEQLGARVHPALEQFYTIHESEVLE